MENLLFIVLFLFVLIGTCFFAYLIGTISSLLNEGDQINKLTEQKMIESQHFCESRNLDIHLTRAVLGHTEYYCESGSLFSLI